jgi:hypothetical protein
LVLIDFALQLLHWQSILLSIFPKRWTERLFLVTHCLSALYKGLSDTLTRPKDPQVRAQTQELRVCFALYIFNIKVGWIFLFKA